MFFFLALFIIILCIIALFSFPQFSPIPYFPSNMKDKEIILAGLNIKNDQTIFDLGAGDGVVIFEAAYEALKHRLNTRFVALEINPILITLMYIKWLLHPNRKNVKIVWGDMFKIKFKSQMSNVKRITFYLYISPWLIEKVITRIKKQIPHAQYVSYYYPIKSLKKKEVIREGVHTLYLYE